MRKALALILASIISLSLVSCTKDNSSDNDTSNISSEISGEVTNTSSSKETSSDEANSEETSSKESSSTTADISGKNILNNEWEYVIVGNNIILKRYVGDSNKITVKNSYVMGNKEYKTEIGISSAKTGPFLGNEALSSIKFEDGIEFPSDKSFMFKDCTGLTYTNSERILASETSSTQEMFSGCTKLNVLDISTVSISKLKNNDNMLNDCLSLSLILVKDNSSRKDILDENNINKKCIVAEKMDNTVWDYSYDKATGVLVINKYKGKGKADVSPAYSIDGVLYTNVSYGNKTTSSETQSNNQSSKPSNNQNSKPSSSSSQPSSPSSSSSSSTESKNETVYYTVKFNTGNGTTVQSQKVLKGQEAQKPSDPSNDTYKFYGWYTSKSYSTRYYFDEPVTNDITLYARWEDANCVYGVEHYKQKGDRETYELADSETIYTIPNSTVTAQPKTYSGYTENKSHPDREYRAKITEDDYDIVLRLYYDRDTFTVRFNSNGGNSINSQTVSKKSKFKEIIPRKTNCTFEGWYTDSNFTDLYDFDSEVKDISLYAKWKSKTADYTVQHYKEDTNGNYSVYDTERFNGSTDSIVSASPRSYEGYTENTSHPERIYSSTIDSSGTTILKLYYSLNTYRVSFSTDGGTAVEDQSIKYGERVRSVQTSKDGCSLDGWYTDTSFSNRYDFNARVTNDITLHAKWITMDKE